LCPPLAQRRYDFMRISSGNKLAGRFGNVPPQKRSTYPWNEARQTNACTYQRVETIIALAEIFLQMLNNLTRPPQ
jgi:hypothetical protein